MNTYDKHLHLDPIYIPSARVAFSARRLAHHEPQDLRGQPRGPRHLQVLGLGARHEVAADLLQRAHVAARQRDADAVEASAPSLPQ